MNNYLSTGEMVTVTAPYAVDSGEGCQVVSIFGVAASDALISTAVELKTTGCFDLAKISTEEWAVGDKIYWKDSTQEATKDGTLGMLIGVALEVTANPSTTGNVRLNGSAPSSAEGPQAAIVALTDSTGLSGTHDDTLAATAALVTLTDSTGDSGTHNDTLADGLTATAPAAISNYTAVVNMSEPVAKAEGEAVSAALATLEGEVTALQVTVAACVTDLTTQNQNDSDLCQKVIEIVTQLAVTNQNISDVAQKVLEIRTALIAAGVIAA